MEATRLQDVSDDGTGVNAASSQGAANQKSADDHVKPMMCAFAPPIVTSWAWADF